MMRNLPLGISKLRCVATWASHTVSHFSYALLFQGPHLFDKHAGIEHSLLA